MSSKKNGGAETPSLPSTIASDLQVKLREDFSKHGQFLIVTTVRHTGTHSIKEQFPEYKHWHCNPECLDLIESTLGNANIITTYRDPLRVAASWYNRAQLPLNKEYDSPHDKGCLFSWKEAWYYYGKILKYIPEQNVFKMDDLEHKLYTHSDTFGLHELLDIGDMDGFYSIADKTIIDYASDQIC